MTISMHNTLYSLPNLSDPNGTGLVKLVWK